MSPIDMQISTGLTGLDRVIRGLLPGDNVVWQVSDISEYEPLVRPYTDYAKRSGRHLIYFRFARHQPLPVNGAELHELDPEAGFEQFLYKIHRKIEQAGRGAFYVFDCLSDLVADWYSDEMLANFFMLTCPYLYDLATIAYFGILRGSHSTLATTPIMNTTQIYSDVYRHQDELYIRPLKIQQRYSPTIHMLHVWRGEAFLPVTDSITSSEILASNDWSTIESTNHRLNLWDRTFFEAEQLVQAKAHGEIDPDTEKTLLHRLIRMVLSRDQRVSGMVEKYITIDDIIRIRKRMIGTGLIGGKSVGVLLARAILKTLDERWRELLEIHDSFFIGSDVFYTFLVRNGCWWVRQKQKNPDSFLEGAETGRQRILQGHFPDHILQQFVAMLDYFGQSPIIVRSSSLLEDNFGNAFAGKYDSVFCVSQAPREKRLDNFLSAVRTIYASTMSEDALVYRARRGMLDKDEQMGLLVQRVSGVQHDRIFYPQIAGVGFSFNPYVWHERIDPSAGMIRLVLGLGTRAVDRADDDYTRLVSLSDPELRPETNFDEVRQYAQRRVDVLDLDSDQHASMPYEEVLQQSTKLPVDLFACPEQEWERVARGRGVQHATSRVLTFDVLLKNTRFVEDMRRMLKILHQAYDYPVDVEFTANFRDADNYKVNLVQCRPLQIREGRTIADPPDDIAENDLILRARSAVMGQSRIDAVDRIIYVVPHIYRELQLSDCYTVARLIGRITRNRDAGEPVTMLMGPGRWGTTTPSLGVPVSFAEINTASILCELVSIEGNLIPELSLGTHFFSDLVENDILYVAMISGQEDNYINKNFLENTPNVLDRYISNADRWSHVVRVLDTTELGQNKQLWINANNMKQKVVCYLA